MDLHEDRVDKPRVTRWGHSLMLAAAEGGSLGVAIGTQLQSTHLLRFVATNHNVSGVRQALLTAIVVSALLVPLLLLATCAMPHATGKRLRLFEIYTKLLSPLCAVGFIPLLFQTPLWRDQTLGFLLTTAAFSVSATLSSRTALNAAVGLLPNKWLADLGELKNTLSWRHAQKFAHPLSIVAVLLLIALCVARTLTSAKGVSGAIGTEWATLHKYSPAGGLSFWLSGVGIRATGHISILGALYTAWAWFFPKSEDLFLLRLIAVSCPALPLYLWVRKVVGTVPAWFMVIAYLSMPLRSILVVSDVFPVGFSVGLFFLSAYYFEVKKLAWAIPVTVLAIAMNEQVALWYVALGLYVAAKDRKSALGASLALIAVGYFAYVAWVHLPGHGILTYSSNSTGAAAPSGHNPPQPLFTSIVNPAYLLARWFEAQTPEFWLLGLLPLGFLPLRNSRWLLWLLPALLLACVATLGSDWQTSAITHLTTLGMVSSIVSLREMKQRNQESCGRSLSTYVGWFAAVLPCVTLLGALWLPRP